ncbi:MAG: integrase, partial [Clostridiales bacterium]|nr:integrase [Clostridiales bacterium]
TGDVKMFLEYLDKKGVAFNGNLNRFYITSYKEHLLKQNYTINTMNKKLNSLNSFNQFLILNGLCHERAVAPSKDKIKIAKGSEGEVEIYSDEEIDKMLFYINDNNIFTGILITYNI